MNRYRILMGLAVCLFWIACSDDKEKGEMGVDEPILIHGGMIGSPSTGTYPPSALIPGTICFAQGSGSGVYENRWTAAQEKNGTLCFDEEHLYPADGSPVYLRGYYPAAELEPGNRVSYRLDGSKDIMVTHEIVGSRNDRFWQTGKRFLFSHLLTRLSFEVCCGEGLPEGAVLQKIEVEGTRPETVLRLDKGTLEFTGSPVTLTAYAAPDGKASGALHTLDKRAAGSRGGTNEPIVLSGDYQEVPGALIVEPGKNIRLTLTATLPDGGTVVRRQMPVRFEEAGGSPEAGTSYLLSVTFNREDPVPAETVSVSITEWIMNEQPSLEI